MLSAYVFWGIYVALVAGAVVLFAATGRATNTAMTQPRLYAVGPWTLKLSLAHAAGFAGTAAMFVLFVVYWFFNHTFSEHGAAVGTAEQYARSFGQVTTAFLGLLVIPASDRSVLHTVLGTNGFLWMHRILGYGMLIGIAGHVIAWGVADGDEGAATAGGANNTTRGGHDDDNPTVPIISFCSFLLFLAMGLLGVEPVRRRAYFIFFRAHQIAVYLTIPVTLAHADGAFIFLLPGLTVWLVDRIMRYKRAPQAATLLDSQDCANDVTMLRFTQPGLVVAPGQYVFVQVPEISTFEWHPFTVAAINAEKSEFTLFVKAMKAPVPVSGCELPYFYMRWLPKRELTWTQQLQGAVRNRAAITLCVDGPCGAVHDLSTFQQVIFIAGGVGITPCAAHMQRLRGAIQARRIELHWAVRDPAVAAPFAAQLDPIADDTRYCGTLYVTRGASADTAEDFKADPLGPSTALTVVSGRPNLVQIMDAFAANKDVLPSATAVVVCGPPGMVDVCARMATCRGFTIIEDSFTFL